MSSEREATRIVRSWLEEGVTALPDRVLDAVLDQVPATPQRRPFWRARRFSEMSNPARLAIVAAAVLVVALVSFRFLPSLTGVGGPDPTPSPGPTVAPLDTPVPLPGGPLAAGTYVMTSVAPFRIVFTVPTGRWTKNVAPSTIWTDHSEGRIGFDLDGKLYADPCNWQAGELDPPVGPSVDDFATALATLPGVEATAPIDVTFAGYPGKFVEIQVSGDESACDEGERRIVSKDDRPLENGRHRFWILDVNGDRLVINAVERTGLIQTYRTQLQQILDSIRLE